MEREGEGEFVALIREPNPQPSVLEAIGCLKAVDLSCGLRVGRNFNEG